MQVKKKTSDVCGVLRSSPISDEVPLFSLVTASLADIVRWGLWLVALMAWSESDDPTTISLRTCRPWVACGSSSSAIVTQRGSLAGPLDLYSTLQILSLREPSISQGVLSQSTLSCVGKGTTCRWLPPEAKTRVLSLLTPLNPCFSHPSLQSPKEERLEHRSLTSHTFKLSPLFPLSSFHILELET